MAKITGPFVELNNAEAEKFHRSITAPDPDVMRQRDKFFADIDQMHIAKMDDGSVEIDFSLKPEPGLSNTEKERG